MVWQASSNVARRWVEGLKGYWDSQCDPCPLCLRACVRVQGSVSCANPLLLEVLPEFLTPAERQEGIIEKCTLSFDSLPFLPPQPYVIIRCSNNRPPATAATHCAVATTSALGMCRNLFPSRPALFQCDLWTAAAALLLPIVPQSLTFSSLLVVSPIPLCSLHHHPQDRLHLVCSGAGLH